MDCSLEVLPSGAPFRLALRTTFALPNTGGRIIPARRSQLHPTALLTVLESTMPYGSTQAGCLQRPCNSLTNNCETNKALQRVQLAPLVENRAKLLKSCYTRMNIGVSRLLNFPISLLFLKALQHTHEGWLKLLNIFRRSDEDNAAH
jgi:hypothetical protein